MTIAQNRMILNHLRKEKTITPLEALRLYGVFRLSARIYDLKDAGHVIATNIIKVGNGKRVGQYRLLKAAKGAV